MTVHQVLKNKFKTKALAFSNPSGNGREGITLFVFGGGEVLRDSLSSSTQAVESLVDNDRIGTFLNTPLSWTHNDYS